MKAILVKNDSFETVGFEVTLSTKTVFSWGVAPISTLYWIKEINIDKWMTEIIEIIRLTTILSEREDFKRDFFDIAIKSNIYKEGESVDFSEYDNETKKFEEKRMNIINKII